MMKWLLPRNNKLCTIPTKDKVGILERIKNISVAICPMNTRDHLSDERDPPESRPAAQIAPDSLLGVAFRNKEIIHPMIQHRAVLPRVRVTLMEARAILLCFNPNQRGHDCIDIETDPDPGLGKER
jgi:hypothetical protein